MNTIRISVLLLLALPACPAWSLSPDDFARGIRIETQGDFPIYRVGIPNDVFESTSMSNLGDMRVFNADGEIVPHELRYVRHEATRESTPVPFFPLPETPAAGGSELNINVGSDGTVVNILGATEESTDAGLPGYLLDLSQLERDVDQLTLRFESSQGFVLNGTLYASDDLQDWRTLQAKVTLASLQFAGQELVHDAMEIPRTDAKYLKLEWSSPPEGITLQSVIVRFVPDHVEPAYRYKVLEPSGSSTGKILDYDTGGFFPVNRLDLSFPQDNTLARGSLMSRASDEVSWRARGKGLFYSLTVSDVRFANDPVTISPTTDRYWRLTLESTDGLGRQQPALRLGWNPAQLHFIARGSGPFTLAFGNANISAASKPIDTLLSDIGSAGSADLIGEARSGSVFLLKGDSALIPERKIPWQRLLLWAVLVGGVALVAFIVFRLFRQLGAGST